MKKVYYYLIPILGGLALLGLKSLVGEEDARNTTNSDENKRSLRLHRVDGGGRGVERDNDRAKAVDQGQLSIAVAAELSEILAQVPGRSRLAALQKWSYTVSLPKLIIGDVEGLSLEQLTEDEISGIAAAIGGRLSRQEDLHVANYLGDVSSSPFLTPDFASGLASGLLRSESWDLVVAKLRGFEFESEIEDRAMKTLGHALASEGNLDLSSQILSNPTLPNSLRRPYLLSWASNKPELATQEIFLEYQRGQDIAGILEDSFETWCLQEPNHAALWLVDQKAGEGKDKMAVVLVRDMIRAQAYERAKDWLDIIVDPKLKETFNRVLSEK